jgi:hypothetical protein
MKEVANLAGCGDRGCKVTYNDDWVVTHEAGRLTLPQKIGVRSGTYRHMVVMNNPDIRSAFFKIVGDLRSDHNKHEALDFVSRLVPPKSRRTLRDDFR